MDHTGIDQSGGRRPTEERCLHRQFEAQAPKTPHAIAIASSGLSLTYWQINRRTNQVARSHRRLGVAPEDRVAIRLEPGFDLAVALLGVLKAGPAGKNPRVLGSTSPRWS
jgi:non-ribosomal peptide synthetase component F